jgi:hypothetical protein
MASNAEKDERKILDCTHAIAFLGTPHRGSDLADWLPFRIFLTQ